MTIFTPEKTSAPREESLQFLRALARLCSPASQEQLDETAAAAALTAGCGLAQC